MILAHCLDDRIPYVCNGFLEQVRNRIWQARRCGKIAWSDLRPSVKRS